MTKRERCEAWIASNPEVMKAIQNKCERDYGWSTARFKAGVIQYLGWLEDNEKTSKGNYRNWNLALRRGLACQFKWEQPNGHRQAKVSDFRRTPGRYEL